MNVEEQQRELELLNEQLDENQDDIMAGIDRVLQQSSRRPDPARIFGGPATTVTRNTTAISERSRDEGAGGIFDDVQPRREGAPQPHPQSPATRSGSRSRSRGRSGGSSSRRSSRPSSAQRAGRSSSAATARMDGDMLDGSSGGTASVAARTNTGRVSGGDIGPEGGDQEQERTVEGHEGEGNDEDGDETPTAALGLESQVRLQKARLRVLTTQLSEQREITSKYQAQLSEFQRQGKADRDENKKLKKRVQVLEADMKRRNRAQSSEGQESEQLHEQVQGLQRELNAAQGLIKQHDAVVRKKDLKLKQATEAIDRLKQRLAEAETVARGHTEERRQDEHDLADRVRVLERQRAELLQAFQSQMRLIDILKRQRIHCEASRLLAFTEEEFVKTLDWCV